MPTSVYLLITKKVCNVPGFYNVDHTPHNALIALQTVSLATADKYTILVLIIWNKKSTFKKVSIILVQ